MFKFITILVVLIALALIFIVLVQKSKGGGLASTFSASNNIMGVRKTTDFLEKATWGLATTMIVLCLVSVAFLSDGKNKDVVSADKIQVEQTQETPANPTEMLTEGSAETAEPAQN